jgi:hypothetical protein
MYSTKNILTKSISAPATVAGILFVAGLVAPEAASTSPLLTTLKPLSGRGAAPDQKFLMSFEIGRKQAVSYFQSEGGHCKLTLMVAEAFNGSAETPV